MKNELCLVYCIRLTCVIGIIFSTCLLIRIGILPCALKGEWSALGSPGSKWPLEFAILFLKIQQLAVCMNMWYFANWIIFWHIKWFSKFHLMRSSHFWLELIYNKSITKRLQLIIGGNCETLEERFCYNELMAAVIIHSWPQTEHSETYMEQQIWLSFGDVELHNIFAFQLYSDLL